MNHQMLIRKRINWLTTLLFVVLVSVLISACGAEEPKVYRVGILSGTDAFLGIADGFKANMTELGYIEGQNIVYDLQQVNADPAEEQRLAQKFADDKVDLIFAFPTEAALAAKAATQGTDIPVVFAFAGVEGADLVNSVPEPGGNITGVRFPGPEQINKRLELMHQLAPQVKRVWIGYDKNYPNNAPALATLRPAASATGITLVEVPAATLAELEADLATRAKSADIGLDAIILMPDIFNHSPAGWELINTFATEHNVPLGGSFPYTVEQGAVFGNANDLVKVGELAAPLADKVFKGTPAGTIRVVTPDEEVWVNYKQAQELRLTVPEGLLSLATEVIR